MYDDAQTPDRLFDTLESKACHLWHADWECAMCQVSGEQHPVSVPRDTEYMAEYINIVRTQRRTTVWSNAKVDSTCGSGGVAPGRPSEHLVGKRGLAPHPSEVLIRSELAGCSICFRSRSDL